MGNSIRMASESEAYLDKTLSLQERFIALVTQYESPLLQYVRCLKGSLAVDAEDLVQEAFLRFLHKVQVDGWDDIASPRNWLYRVAHNLVMDVGRRRQLEKRYQEKKKVDSEQELMNDSSQLNRMIQEEIGGQAVKLLQKLPEEDREVLLLKVNQNMTLKEISEVTGENIGKLAYRINRSLEKLSNLLKEQSV